MGAVDEAPWGSSFVAPKRKRFLGGRPADAGEAAAKATALTTAVSKVASADATLGTTLTIAGATFDSKASQASDTAAATKAAAVET